MKLKNDELVKLLLDNKVSEKNTLEALLNVAEDTKTPLLNLLYDKKVITRTDFTKLYAKEIGIDYVSLAEMEIPKDLLETLPERVARKYQAVVFAEKNGQIQVAMVDPENVEDVQFIQKKCNYNLKIYIATENDVNTALEMYKEGLSSEIDKAIKENPDEPIAEEEGIEDDASADNVQAIISEAPVTKAVNILIEYAIKSRASDIHIEPRDNTVQIRYRIDGILRDTMSLPKALLSSIVSKVKILANLRIDEHRIPQDGRIKFKYSGLPISIRVSTIPVMDGEKVVMRLLDESAKVLTLPELGYKGQALDTISQALKKPHGMLLVTGPTGSGKSTTLYSVISDLNEVGINISTVEDPVEYRIKGVNQIQVNTKVGMTFATGLRALLRQDPDIIMVGEIRDTETAEIAVNSALTGHVVLSTLHTNDAAGCLPRLLDMEIEPFLIASTVNAVIGQRLVRRLCPHCQESFLPDEKTTEEIINDFCLNREYLIKNQQSFNKDSVAKERSSSSYDEIELRDNLFITNEERDKNVVEQRKNKAQMPKIVLYRSKGCDKCNKTGYAGRVGIYEVLEVTEEIGKLIIAHASSNTIRDEAIKHGMITMQQDGLLKCFEGITTVEEVLRVTKE